LNSSAAPARTTIIFTQSYAIGSIAACTVRVRASIGVNSRGRPAGTHAGSATGPHSVPNHAGEIGLVRLEEARIIALLAWRRLLGRRRRSSRTGGGSCAGGRPG